MRQVHALGVDLRDGLHGRRVPSAARRLRQLLAVDGVVLADLDGPVAAHGTSPAPSEV